MNRPSQAHVNITSEMERVFDIEIEALRAVQASIAEDFEKAVRAIAACKGNVVLTGIGKSGIIASKIAATLTSTGTPSVFLHASEAMHGDLGIVSSDSVVIAIGKSGESVELNSLLPAIKRIGATIIAITANARSKMAGAADIVLNLDIPREACPLNLAPTSSTTACLVVGDALAVALMHLKKVSSEDFALRHPGGQLGRRLLLTVKDLMRTGERNPTIDQNESIRTMLIGVTAGQAGAISVVDRELRLVGFVSDYDIRKALENHPEFFDLRIPAIMNANPTFVYSDQLASEAIALMQARSKPTAVLPVLDRDRKVVGMIHIMDLVSAGL